MVRQWRASQNNIVTTQKTDIIPLLSHAKRGNFNINKGEEVRREVKEEEAPGLNNIKVLMGKEEKIEVTTTSSLETTGPIRLSTGQEANSHPDRQTPRKHPMSEKTTTGNHEKKEESEKLGGKSTLSHHSPLTTESNGVHTTGQSLEEKNIPRTPIENQGNEMNAHGGNILEEENAGPKEGPPSSAHFPVQRDTAEMHDSSSDKQRPTELDMPKDDFPGAKQ